jgi:zinc transport system permease protein
MFDVLQYSFMQQAFMAGIIIALLCPVIGLFLVVRRLALIGDGLGHISFAGVATGWLTGIYPVYTAMLFAVIGAIGIEKMREKQRHYADTALALIFYTGMALAVVLTSMVRTASNNLLSYLFGSIVTVAIQDVIIIASLGTIVLAMIGLFYQELLFVACDEEAARVSGLPVSWLNMLLAVLTAVTVSVAMRVVGILLVSALMIIPVAASLQVARSFWKALVWAVFFAQFSVIIGLTGSFYLNLAPGGAIVLTGVLTYIIVMIGKSLTKWRSTAGSKGRGWGLGARG